MKKEHRYIWIDDASMVVSNEIDILSIGSESCILPFFNIARKWNLLSALIEQYKRLKIVMPRVSQNEISEAKETLEKLVKLKRPIEIVINDWGVFEYCRSRAGLFKIHIGRQLSRSFIDCPWHNEIIENESKTICDALVSHPYNDYEWIGLLKSMGVKGIELNSIDGNMDTHILINEELELSVHKDDYLLSCGRTCLAKRVESTVSCRELCRKKYELELMGKWHNVFDNQVEANEYEKKMLQGMFISGKRVLLPQKLSEVQMETCGVDVIIESKI